MRYLLVCLQLTLLVLQLTRTHELCYNFELTRLLQLTDSLHTLDTHREIRTRDLGFTVTDIAHSADLNTDSAAAGLECYSYCTAF